MSCKSIMQIQRTSAFLCTCLRSRMIPMVISIFICLSVAKAPRSVRLFARSLLAWSPCILLGLVWTILALNDHCHCGPYGYGGGLRFVHGTAHLAVPIRRDEKFGWHCRAIGSPGVAVLPEAAYPGDVRPYLRISSLACHPAPALSCLIALCWPCHAPSAYTGLV